MEVLKKGGYHYGNKEYPKLEHGPVYLIEQVGKKRLIEQELELIIQREGYMPAPEVIKERALQKKVLGIWWTIKFYRYRIPGYMWIPAACFGDKYDISADWEKVGLNTI